MKGNCVLTEANSLTRNQVAMINLAGHVNSQGRTRVHGTLPPGRLQLPRPGGCFLRWFLCGWEDGDSPQLPQRLTTNLRSPPGFAQTGAVSLFAAGSRPHPTMNLPGAVRRGTWIVKEIGQSPARHGAYDRLMQFGARLVKRTRLGQIVRLGAEVRKNLALAGFRDIQERDHVWAAVQYDTVVFVSMAFQYNVDKCYPIYRQILEFVKRAGRKHQPWAISSLRPNCIRP